VTALRADKTSIEPDARLRSTPEPVLWGYIAANLPPALNIKSGQVIEIEALYGINNSGPGKGVLPQLLKEPAAKLVRIDLERRVALFSEDIEIPLNPFMGIMAVSPPTSLGMVSSTPPGAWGGNIDLKFTGIGASLYLPVLTKGRNFLPVTVMQSRAMARRTAEPLKSRSSRRSNSFYTKANTSDRLESRQRQIIC
jgi:acetamidase/formamidase